MAYLPAERLRQQHECPRLRCLAWLLNVVLVPARPALFADSDLATFGLIDFHGRPNLTSNTFSNATS